MTTKTRHRQRFRAITLHHQEPTMTTRTRKTQRPLPERDELDETPRYVPGKITRWRDDLDGTWHEMGDLDGWDYEQDARRMQYEQEAAAELALIEAKVIRGEALTPDEQERLRDEAWAAEAATYDTDPDFWTPAQQRQRAE